MQKYKILLIDDNVDMLIIGRRIFERAGHVYLEARNGQDGLNIALDKRPDIIILDYMLPDMSGTDFIRMMAGKNRYADILGTPIVILTARPHYIKELDECYANGLKAFLHKPFGHRELVNIVENIIRVHQLGEDLALSPKIHRQADEAARPLSIDDKWFDDVVATADALRGLCVDLKMINNSNLSEEQLLELDAIFNSSTKLDRLLKQNSQRAVFSK